MQARECIETFMIWKEAKKQQCLPFKSWPKVQIGTLCQSYRKKKNHGNVLPRYSLRSSLIVIFWLDTQTKDRKRTYHLSNLLIIALTSF